MIDVIIPLYNGEKWIKEALDSVFCQSMPPSAVIVVDDGSTDNSAACVKAYSNVLLVRNERKGPTAARNEGLRHSRSPFVAFLDQDDVWHKDHLKTLVRVLSENTECDLAIAGTKKFMDDCEPTFSLSNQAVEQVDLWELYPFCIHVQTPSSFLVRRTALLEAGGWNEKHCGASDYSLSMILSTRRKVAIYHGRTVAQRVHLQSRSHRLWAEASLEHMNRIVSINDDLRVYFEEHSTGRNGFVLRRNRIVHFLRDAVVSFIDADFASFRSSTMQLKKIFSEEENSFQCRVIKRFWHLTIRHFNHKFDEKNLLVFFFRGVRAIESRISGPWSVCLILVLLKIPKIINGIASRGAIAKRSRL